MALNKNIEGLSGRPPRISPKVWAKAVSVLRRERLSCVKLTEYIESWMREKKMLSADEKPISRGTFQNYMTSLRKGDPYPEYWKQLNAYHKRKGRR